MNPKQVAWIERLNWIRNHLCRPSVTGLDAKLSTELIERLDAAEALATKWEQIALALASGEITYAICLTTEGPRHWVRERGGKHIEGESTRAALLNWLDQQKGA